MENLAHVDLEERGRTIREIEEIIHWLNNVLTVLKNEQELERIEMKDGESS